MRLRKSKPTTEQGRVGRQVRPVDTPGAFSYYTSRPAVTPGTRETSRQDSPATQKRAGIRLPLLSTQLPLWLLIGVAVVCFAKVLLLSTNPKIVIVGQNGVSASYVQPVETYTKAASEILSKSITNRSKLTVNATGVRNAMQQKFPEMQAASMTLPLVGNRPIVYLDVAQPTLILQTNHGSFALNAGGVVLAPVGSKPAGVPVVVDQSGVIPVPGKQFLPSSNVEFIKTVNVQLSAAKLPVNTYLLPPNKPYELDMRIMDKPYVVRFNLQADARKQSGAAIGAIKQLPSGAPAEYMDVRVPGRVYYK